MELRTEEKESSSIKQGPPNSRPKSIGPIEVSLRTATKAIARILFAAQGSLLIPHSKASAIADPSESTPSIQNSVQEPAKPKFDNQENSIPLLPNHPVLGLFASKTCSNSSLSRQKTHQKT